MHRKLHPQKHDMKYFTMGHLDNLDYQGMLQNYDNNALMYDPIKSVSDIYDNAVEIQNTLFDDEDHGYHKGRPGQFKKRSNDRFDNNHSNLRKVKVIAKWNPRIHRYVLHKIKIPYRNRHQNLKKFDFLDFGALSKLLSGRKFRNSLV